MHAREHAATSGSRSHPPVSILHRWAPTLASSACCACTIAASWVSSPRRRPRCARHPSADGPFTPHGPFSHPCTPVHASQVLSLDGDALVDAAREYLNESEREWLGDQIWGEFHRKDYQHLWGGRILIADLKAKASTLMERALADGHGMTAAAHEDLTDTNRVIAARLIQSYRLQRSIDERKARSAADMMPLLLDSPRSDSGHAKHERNGRHGGGHHYSESDSHSREPSVAPTGSVFGSALGLVDRSSSQRRGLHATHAHHGRTGAHAPHALHNAHHATPALNDAVISASALTAVKDKVNEHSKQLSRIEEKLDKLLKMASSPAAQRRASVVREPPQEAQTPTPSRKASMVRFEA